MTANDDAVRAAMLAMVRPTWADPGYSLATSLFRLTSVTLVGGANTSVAKANPRRWAIGFAFGNSLGSGFAVAPSPRPDLYGFPLGSNNPVPWFNIFTHGPMVSTEWYAVSSGGLSFGVYEVEVQ